MIAEVIVDITNSKLDKIFDYKIPSSNFTCGSRVIVPFGNRKIEGYIINLKEKSDFDDSKLKYVLRVVDDIPVLSQEFLDLANYMHKKYHVSMASILRLFLPSEMRNGKVRQKNVRFAFLKENVILTDAISSLRANAENQIAILKFLQENGKTQTSIINEKYSSQALNSLIKKGFIEIIEERVSRLPYKNVLNENVKVKLTDEQENAINVVLSSNKPTLIHGVTGSGKTEVYLKLIEETVKLGKNAILLVPEIALTPQTLSRLRGRFKDDCAILHSGLSAGEKFDEWWRLRSGEAKIAVGARSAIFAPLNDVGIIIIDEEHEQSYESETSPRYITSDIALFRANYKNAKLVIGSATPKIESYLKASRGEYNLAVLKNRANKKPMPKIIITDMREEIKRGNPSAFSGELKYQLQKAIENGNQAMIFLNRRGYSQKIICRECGYVAKCEHCDVSLTYHKSEDILKCHYCGATYKMPEGCVDCGSVNINYSGTGTQKVVSELKELFPDARILRMDNDTTQNKEGHFKILKEFGDRKADILVGTQMIAKGHDFPNVSLVGILDADMSLYFSDYRSGERTFQLITQVSGRCGRADSSGTVVLQTYSPFNTILRFATAYDYEGFYKYEINLRKSSHFPPFADILRIMVEGNDEEKALSTLKTVFFKCKEVYDKYSACFIYFDKMKSPVKRINNNFRYQVLARVKEGNSQIIDEFYKIANENNVGNVNCYLEINPSNMN